MFDCVIGLPLTLYLCKQIQIDMKKTVLYLLALISVLTLSANPDPCEGKLTWDEEVVQIAYSNGEVVTMSVVDYYSDNSEELFVISAIDSEGSLAKIMVKELPFHLTISIDYKNSSGVDCTETRIVSKR